MTTTITPTRASHHPMVVMAIVALAATVAVALALVLNDSGSSTSPARATASEPVARVETPVGTPDALERRALSTPAAEPLRYGSPDAAERWIGS